MLVGAILIQDANVLIQGIQTINDASCQETKAICSQLSVHSSVSAPELH